MLTKEETLSKAIRKLLLSEPFYGMFLITLNKRWLSSLPTAAVTLNGINYEILINPEFWEKKLIGKDDNETNALKIAVLKHELLHLAFFHLTDYKHLKEREIANIAMDIEINQWITGLPEWVVTMDKFPELNLEPKQGTNYYYKKLMEGKQKGNCPNLNAMLDASAAGKITVEIDSKTGKITVKLPNHSTWETGEMSEATEKLIRKQIEYVLKDVADQVVKSRGTVPGELAEIIARINTVEPPKFNWRAYLRRFSGNAVKIYTKKSRRKLSKRFEGNPGLKIKHQKHILVGIDTSGSVSTNELKEFLHEIHHMQKTGSEVTIAQADSAISHIGKFNPKHDFKVHGRGGTRFEPIIDYYNANTNKYTALIYFTDGEAPAPPKAKGKMLWVLSSQSKINPSLIGQQIQLN